jgi:O-antigen/teichoic acid export membrane protein
MVTEPAAAPALPAAPRPAKSPTLAGNVAATVAGTAVAIIVQIACLPMQLDALGLAAWGVLGLQAVIQGVVLTLDLGLGSVVGRELARLSHAMADTEKTAEASREARNLVRTLEIGYWLVGILAAVSIWIAAPWLATHWVAQGITPVPFVPHDQVAKSLRAMGIVAGMLLPGGLYTAVLAGLQRQIGAQILRMGWSFAINVGAVVAVRMTGAGLDAFFAVQLATTLVWTIASAGLCWYRLPGAGRPRWHPEAFARLWRFAAGMAVITVAGTVLVQIDKVALSYLVPLELAGGYFVAYTIGTTPLLLVKPLFAVIFPRLTRSVATPGADVSGDFHRNAQIMAALVLPLAAVVATFGVPLVQAWTRNPDTAALAGPLAGLLIVGTALHALMHVPYALQLAHGWVRVSVHILAVVLSVMIPLMAVLVWRFSVTGAALGWLIMHALQLTLCVAATHGRLLPGERLRWLLRDFAIPLAVAVALAWTGKVTLSFAAPTLLAPEGNRLLAFAAMAVVGLVAQIGTVLACDQLFGAVRQRLLKRG